MRVDRIPGSSNYRPEGEVENWLQTKDPIKILRNKLIELEYTDEAGLSQIEMKCQQEFDEALEFAMNSPEPKPESIFEWIYS
jgi:pyruvate dehydrogenase E1 component alpha subunit